MTTYCVYAHVDPRTGVPKYIGQGKGKHYLWWRGWMRRDTGEEQYGFAPWLRELKALGLEPIVLIVLDNLTRGQALIWEIGLIASIGRVCDGNGPLYNLSPGGLGGCPRSDATKCKMSAAARKRCADPDERQRMSQTVTAHYANPEVRLQASQVAKARWAKPGERRRASKAAKARYAKPGERQRASKAAKAVWAKNPEARRRVSQAARYRQPAGTFKGISLNKQTGKWCATIYVNGKNNISESSTLKSQPRLPTTPLLICTAVGKASKIATASGAWRPSGLLLSVVRAGIGEQHPQAPCSIEPVKQASVNKSTVPQAPVRHSTREYRVGDAGVSEPVKQ